jgi:hypothetical protein
MSGPFVRKNALVASAVFTPMVGDDSPSSATCVLNYTNLSGVTQQVSLPMAEDDNIWSVTWDSSAAAAGLVQWMIYSEGNIQAATQGEFIILANAANNV